MAIKPSKGFIYLLIVAVFVFGVPSEAHAEPSYAKYGRAAMQETANRYPDANIIDYKYEGHFETSGARNEERFRLWLRGSGGEFGVRVHVYVAADTGQVRNVELEEIAR
ncbi:DUF3889 domain-containing protein [Paenibacillus glycanilyticus]|uniref:DUF3889 domain-containing protein n=1 Tax=Paenibacillus glycanilyticus TaxID=126569 RepID=A0ABQ6GN59_9BACL|nr:DUF3889 domain-containing protein [Paenibacillus glycanilyticus]GLX70781.1 hypothetical protein MU1_51270 [Paenibacillus glycanilyticus]